MTDKPIKSVRRVFEILELFDNVRRPLSAKEISDVLDYPLASAHALVKSMHELGYLDFDPPKWTYVPSRNFSVLADWVSDFLDRETRLLECVEVLNQQTKETVNLSRLTGADIKIVHGLECIHPVGVSVRVGTLMPAMQSLTGLTALASLDERALSTFLDRVEGSGSVQVDEENRALIEDVKSELIHRGTVSRSDFFIQGIGAVCIPIQTHFSKDLLIIGVVGPSDRISQYEQEHRRTVKRVIDEFNITTQFRLRNPRKPSAASVAN